MPQPANAGEGSAQPAGAGDREVQPGDCVFSLAEEAGHLWQTIWNDPGNQQLKAKRGSPHVLLPGDRIVLPPIELKEAAKPTDRKHRFRRKGVPLFFDLKVLRGNQPRAGVPYLVLIEGRSQNGTVPGDGVIHIEIKPTDRTGTLILRPGPKQEEYELSFGHLDPAHATSGMRARLRNLGLLGEDESEEATADALGRFQRLQDLPVTGELDDATARKLTEVHGS